jgi:hypothetical protein
MLQIISPREAVRDPIYQALKEMNNRPLLGSVRAGGNVSYWGDFARRARSANYNRRR